MEQSHPDTTKDKSVGEEEFFDRERWRDVESEENPSEGGFPEHVLGPTSHSLAVLLLVAIASGVIGITSVLLFNSLVGWNTGPPTSPTDYRSISQEWFRYSLEHVVFFDVNRPVCFSAAMDGKVVVGEEQPPSLHIFSSDSGHQQIISLDSPPLCLVIGNDDTLFPNDILVACEQELTVYTMDGTKRFAWKLPAHDADIRSVALSDQFIFAADSKNHVVYRFDENGQKLGEIGRSGHREGGRRMSQNGPSDRKKSDDLENDFQGFVVLRSPISLTVSPKTGLLYVTNPGKHRIEAFTQQGHWEPSLCWGTESSDVTGFTGCCNPVSIIALKDGKIATVEKSINRVKVYFPNGTLDCVVAGPDMLDIKPNNIPQLDAMPFRTVDENNGTPVSIAFVENEAVLIFDPVFRIVRYLRRTDLQNSNQ